MCSVEPLDIQIGFMEPTNFSTSAFWLLAISNFFPECITASDCPAGGTNYVCNANKCDCPSPKVLDGDRCVGMLPFEKEKITKA